ncbi:MAG TPA: hypothetical protein VKF38_08280 [Anaerolineaceae bacterium]|nr:hypothetical protein [Anaerolineaceae bacterium]
MSHFIFLYGPRRIKKQLTTDGQCDPSARPKNIYRAGAKNAKEELYLNKKEFFLLGVL